MSLALDTVRQVRVGASLGFTLYAQFGPEPTPGDPYLGVLNNAALAELVVAAINHGMVPVDSPWLAIGRLIYPEPGVDSLDHFVGCMTSAAVARWVANKVYEAHPPPAPGEAQ